MWDCCREPLSRDERRALLDEMLDSCAPPPPPSPSSPPPPVSVPDVERRRRRLLSAHQVDEYYDNVGVGYRYVHALWAPSREGPARQLG